MSTYPEDSEASLIISIGGSVHSGKTTLAHILAKILPTPSETIYQDEYFKDRSQMPTATYDGVIHPEELNYHIEEPYNMNAEQREQHYQALNARFDPGVAPILDTDTEFGRQNGFVPRQLVYLGRRQMEVPDSECREALDLDAFNTTVQCLQNYGRIPIDSPSYNPDGPGFFGNYADYRADQDERERRLSEREISHGDPEESVNMLSASLIKTLTTAVVDCIARNQAKNAAVGFPGKNVAQPLRDSANEREKERYQRQWGSGLRKTGLIDGFLLYLQERHAGDSVTQFAKWDVKLFLPTSKDEATRRRFRQKEYIDKARGGTRDASEPWKTKAYFDFVAWDRYMNNSEWLFDGGIVEVPDPSFEADDISAMVVMRPDMDSTLQYTVLWAVETIIVELEFLEEIARNQWVANQETIRYMEEQQEGARALLDWWIDF